MLIDVYNVSKSRPFSLTISLSILSKFNNFWKNYYNLFTNNNRVRIGRSRSSKVVDFGTNRKGVCDFLLVTNSNFNPVLHRFWDAATYEHILLN